MGWGKPENVRTNKKKIVSFVYLCERINYFNNTKPYRYRKRKHLALYRVKAIKKSSNQIKIIALLMQGSKHRTSFFFFHFIFCCFSFPRSANKKNGKKKKEMESVHIHAIYVEHNIYSDDFFVCFRTIEFKRIICVYRNEAISIKRRYKSIRSTFRCMNTIFVWFFFWCFVCLLWF